MDTRDPRSGLFLWRTSKSRVILVQMTTPGPSTPLGTASPDPETAWRTVGSGDSGHDGPADTGERRRRRHALRAVQMSGTEFHSMWRSWTLGAFVASYPSLRPSCRTDWLGRRCMPWTTGQSPR